MNPVKRRTGFTLLEIVVVAGVLLCLLGVFFLAYVSGQNQSLALDFQTSSLQAVDLLVSRILADFDNLLPGPIAVTYAEPTPQPGISLSKVSDGRGAFGLPLKPGLDPLEEHVSYRFHPADHRVHRNEESLPFGPFETVQFTFYPARQGDPTPPFGDTLVVEIVCVPLECVGRTNSATPRAEFRIQLRSPQATVNHLCGFWNERL